MAKEVSELNYVVKRIHLNGVPKRIVADPEITLLTVIRDQQKLTGTILKKRYRSWSRKIGRAHV